MPCSPSVLQESWAGAWFGFLTCFSLSAILLLEIVLWFALSYSSQSSSVPVWGRGHFIQYTISCSLCAYTEGPTLRSFPGDSLPRTGAAAAQAKRCLLALHKASPPGRLHTPREGCFPSSHKAPCTGCPTKNVHTL